MEHIDINIFNYWARNHITDESKFDDDGFIIMDNNENYKSTGIIAKIFEDNWDSYYARYHKKLDEIRPNCSIEVKKIIDCANHNLGANIYVCPKCYETYFCHHTCKGKLCSSCGIKTQKIVTQKILEKIINSKHRHMTFTIPSCLRNFFFDDLYATNLLFEAVADTIYSIVNGKVKKKKIKRWNNKYIPGFYAFLHTFGRPLNFNPHIHVIIAETIIDRNGFTKKYDYFNYDALSKRFMKILLDKMEKYFGKDFKQVKNKMYLKYPNGFYVNNRLEDDGYKFKSIEELVKYVTRYCARPAMAESRIINYDGENVTFFYTDHTNEEYHEETVSAFEFITKLLQHLLPVNFKSIRNFGFYSKNSDLCDKMIKIISSDKAKVKRQLTKWINCIILSFKRIPIMCPKCSILMDCLFEVS